MSSDPIASLLSAPAEDYEGFVQSLPWVASGTNEFFLRGTRSTAVEPVTTTIVQVCEDRSMSVHEV